MEEFKGKSPHRPLLNETDIRIITLLPNTKFNATIECELEHITLEAGAGYEAISYNWGDPNITEPILLDGQSYPVTVNIFTALKYLRLEGSPRRLWVDSLCINQKDTKERSHEIQKMRDIYKLASQVLVWIGDYEPFTRNHVKRLFDFMIRMVSSIKLDTEAETISNIGFDEMWRLQEEIHEFLAPRHWFERMWIIQEVSVRKRLCRSNLDQTPILICGHLQLPLFYLDMTQALWSRPRYKSQLGLPQICPTLNLLSCIWNNYQEMIEYAPMCTTDRQLAWVLSLASEFFHATDAKDFIYSVLGLLVTDEIPLQLRPDYDKSRHQVLIDSAAYIIESGTIDIIQFNSMKNKDLPTWVPDWRYKAPLLINEGFPFDYELNIKISSKLAIEVDILSFTEIFLTAPGFEIKSQSDDMTYVWSEFFLDLVDSLHGMIEEVKGYDSFRQAVSQLLLVFDMNARRLYYGGWHAGALNDAPAMFSVTGQSMRNKLKVSNSLDRLFEIEMWKSVAESIAGRSLFRCRDGSIGIMGQCHVQPQEGDKICSIKGACGEFVLRPFKDGYQLIGICQRTTKCFDTKLADVGLECWLRSMHILEILEPLWETMELQRILIY
ncbi:heterokaryon incompatibility protein-domain-containing protein [Biscogniauxia mediterranea]|nr:heterokaryon incompatibility protein-domain-containing protein [Biscogniauxia mediterranea]